MLMSFRKSKCWLRRENWRAFRSRRLSFVNLRRKFLMGLLPRDGFAGLAHDLRLRNTAVEEPDAYRQREPDPMIPKTCAVALMMVFLVGAAQSSAQPVDATGRLR